MAKEKEQVFMVIGLGAFGRRLCEVLSAKGGQVVAVDHSAERINRIKDTVTQAIVMDATDEEGFSRLDVEDSDIAVVAIGDDIESSILATALLKKAGARYLIARAINNIHRQVLKQIGADEIINIEEDGGEQLAIRLIAPQILDRIPLSEGISIAEIYCPDDFVGKTLIQLDLRTKLNINVIAIKRNKIEVDEEGNPRTREELVFPRGDHNLEQDDILLAVGFNRDIEVLKDL